MEKHPALHFKARFLNILFFLCWYVLSDGLDHGLGSLCSDME